MHSPAAPLAVLLVAAAAAPLAGQDHTDAGKALAELLATPELAGARIGVEVRDLGTGEVLVAHDADKGFLTASNMKLVSAAVALQTLGAEFTFTTRVMAAKAPEDGAVVGDLFLVGDGDPSLGGRPRTETMAPMKELAEKLTASGLKRVRGRVLGVDATPLRLPYGNGWQWDYLDEDYAAPCSGLNFAENVVELQVVPGTDGREPTFRLLPDVGALRAELDVLAAAPGVATELHWTRPLRDEWLRVTGALAAGPPPEPLRIAVTDPPAYAGRALCAALRDRGVEIPGGGDSADHCDVAMPADAVLLAELRSRPLAELLRPLLKHSINLYAEQLWRTAALRAAAKTSPVRDSAGCEQFAKGVLQQLGVDTAGMLLADGSGLSRRNLVQPRHLAALLVAIAKSERLRPIAELLPVGGRDGTLFERLRGNATAGHVRAKTGFVSYVACLSGYIDRPGSRPPLVFSIMLNNFTCPTDAAKAAIDAFVTRLCVASGWSE